MVRDTRAWQRGGRPCFPSLMKTVALLFSSFLSRVTSSGQRPRLAAVGSRASSSIDWPFGDGGRRPFDLQAGRWVAVAELKDEE